MTCCGRRFLLVALLLNAASMAWADVGMKERGIVEQWLKTAAKARTVQGEFDQIRYLKGVNKPLIRQGKIWMQKPASFRWQIGEPPTMIAIRGTDEKLTVLDVREKKAKVWTREALLQQEAEGKGQGIAMLGSGFSDSMAEFEKQFEIEDVAPATSGAGDYVFTLKLRDRKATVFVKNVVITVGLADGSMKSFVILMRDGSRMETQVRRYTLNGKIDPDVFRVNTTGYEIEEVKP